MWVGENESAKFWADVLNSLRNRGVEEILIACTDNLTVFSQAIEAVFPKALRKLIYTNNTIEGFNRQLKKVTKAKSVFLTDDSLFKISKRRVFRIGYLTAYFLLKKLEYLVISQCRTRLDYLFYCKLELFGELKIRCYAEKAAECRLRKKSDYKNNRRGKRFKVLSGDFKQSCMIIACIILSASGTEQGIYEK